MRRLVILRPEPGASTSAARARAMGLEVETVPLFAVQPVAWDTPDPADFDALIITSANALRHGGAGLKALIPLPVHAVGVVTAQAARVAGFTVAATGSAGIGALALPPGHLLHLAGRDHHPVPGATTIIVYEAAAIAAPALDVEKKVVTVHSARAGARLAELVAGRGSTAIAAISAAAAEACGVGWQEVAVTATPDDAALLALAAALCHKPGA